MTGRSGFACERSLKAGPPPFCEVVKHNHLDGRPGSEIILLTVARQHRTLTGFAIKPLHPGIEAPKRLREFYILPEDKSSERVHFTDAVDQLIYHC